MSQGPRLLYQLNSGCVGQLVIKNQNVVPLAAFQLLQRRGSGGARLDRPAFALQRQAYALGYDVIIFDVQDADGARFGAIFITAKHQTARLTLCRRSQLRERRMTPAALQH